MAPFPFNIFRKKSAGGFYTAAEKMNSLGVGSAIRKGLSAAMPIMALGSIARFIYLLPIPSYQRYVAITFGSNWKTLFTIIENATFTIVSPIVCMGISYSLALDDKKDRARVINPIVAAAVSVACMTALIATDNSEPMMDRLGVSGLFIAIVVAVIATRIFSALSHSRFLLSRIYGSPKDRDLTGVVGSIIPAIITFGVFIVLAIAVASLRVPDYGQCLAVLVEKYTESKPNSLLLAVLSALILHIAMFFGIYDPGTLDIIATPALAISSSGILTAEFFKQFVFIGGSGSTFALLIATLVSARRDSLRTAATLGTVPSLVNSNEMIVFGAPVAYNSYLLIPFIASPVVLTVISYAAIALGIVPKAATLVESSMPIFAGGLITTGYSPAGAVLQLFGLAVTTLIYLPFVKTYDRVLACDNTLSLKRLMSRVENLAEQSNYRLMATNGSEGNLARAIASDLGLALREAFETFGVTMERMRLNAVIRGREDKFDDEFEKFEGDFDDDVGEYAEIGSDGAKKRMALEAFLTAKAGLNSLGQLRRLPPMPGAEKTKRKIGELTMMYQPLVTQDSSIIGIEALLRWNHAEFGYLPPPLVVAIAEEAGYGDDLGRFVFMSAFSTLKDLIKQDMGDVVMSVNITPGQLDNESFAADVTDIARSFGVPTDKIEFEITERVALGGKRRINMLRKLHYRGFRLAMDDFGMGHGSLMYLKQFDLTSLKLDGSLSREIENNQACREIVSSIIQLAKTMDIKVVAEYVETVRQREILRDLGCEQFQGYLYSAALEANGLIKYCQKRRHGQE